jgi:peptidoglycan/LPS O-acetylase OafA/YrhL
MRVAYGNGMATRERDIADRARYADLDGLRGVAALLVVLFHISGRVPGWSHLATHGYLAVDFFLMLSGFVMALSYQHKLQSGLSVAGFFARRAIRLYPLALLGAIVGVAGLWAYQSFRVGAVIPASTMLTVSLLNLAVLPYFSSRYFDANLFPANIPLWSLFGEICINLLWAASVAAGLGRRWKYAAVPVCGVVFAVCAFEAGTANLGWGSHNCLGGAARVAFCFLLGTLCFDLKRFIVPRLRSSNAMVLAGALVCALEFPLSGVVWDIATVFVVLPVILSGGISAGRRVHAPVREFLGDVSYPLYIIHFPILQIVLRLREKFLPALPPYVGGIAAVGLSVVAAIALYHLFDAPVRALFSRTSAGREQRGLSLPAD